MSEGSRYFEENSAVQRTLRNIVNRLDGLGIAYSVVGGLALFTHGFRRFTDDVDILVSAEGLKKIHEELDGLGYVPPFAGSKHLRDTESGVRIEFLVAGQFPGDGKPKPVAFPDPAAVTIERDGIKYLQLSTLIELKLASGMTNPSRLKDITDVLELIRILGLPKDFAQQLAPYVRERFVELWTSTRQTVTRYLRIWRTQNASTLDVLIKEMPDSADLLESMKADGVTLDRQDGTAGEYAYLVTTDPEVAKKYDMHDEAEFLDRGETK